MELPCLLIEPNRCLPPLLSSVGTKTRIRFATCLLLETVASPIVTVRTPVLSPAPLLAVFIKHPPRFCFLGLAARSNSSTGSSWSSISNSCCLRRLAQDPERAPCRSSPTTVHSFFFRQMPWPMAMACNWFFKEVHMLPKTNVMGAAAVVARPAPPWTESPIRGNLLTAGSEYGKHHQSVFCFRTMAARILHTSPTQDRACSASIRSNRCRCPGGLTCCAPPVSQPGVKLQLHGCVFLTDAR